MLFFGAFAGPAATSYFSATEAQTNRIAQLRLEDYRAIDAENQNFDQMLDRFTHDINLGKAVDGERRRDMIASLIRQYDQLGQFQVYVQDTAAQEKIRSYRSSLLDLRRSILDTKTEQDLNNFYIVMHEALEKRKLATPVMAKAVGKVSEISQSAIEQSTAITAFS